MGVMVREGLCDDMSSRVLDNLEFMEGLLGEAKEERVAVVDTGGGEAVDNDGGGTGHEGGGRIS